MKSPKKRSKTVKYHKKSNHDNDHPSLKESALRTTYACTVFIVLYLLMELVPSGEIIMGSMRHRFYVDVLNLVVAGYILSNYNKLFLQSIPIFFRQTIPILYGLFVLLSTLSILVAVNKTEGWVDVAYVPFQFRNVRPYLRLIIWYER